MSTVLPTAAAAGSAPSTVLASAVSKAICFCGIVPSVFIPFYTGAAALAMQRR